MASLTTWKIEDEVQIRMGNEGLAARPPQTIIQAFEATVAKYGPNPAQHVKRDGAWHAITFQEYYDRCKLFAKALLSLDVDRFAGVGIIGFNAPEWTTAMLGAIFAGGVGVGIYTTNQAHACEYIAKHSDSAVVVCDGLKQLEKFLVIQENLPKLKALVVYNDSVPENLQSKVPVYDYEAFMKLGESVDDARLKERIEVQKPNNCCSLIYTSGTTGDPKGVMLSHDNVTFTCESARVMICKYIDSELDNRDRLVSFLPLSHVAAQVIDIFINIACGIQIFFCQPDALKGSLGVTLKEVRPTIFVAVPRVYEKIAEKMWSISAQTKGVKKALAQWARTRGSKKSEMAQYGNSGGEPCGFGVANAVVLSRIKEALGLDQCVCSISAAAPISPEILNYFASLDLPLYDLFGQSEATGPETLNLRGMWKSGSSGRVLEGMEIAVVPDTQEVIFRGRNVMMGYFRAEAETKATIDADGWLHTGDCGVIDDDGFMTITGRIKELIVTAGGENVPPVLIEHEIKEALPILSNVMVIGDKRKFLTCLVTLRVEVDSEGRPTDKLDAKARSICAEIGSSAKSVAEAKGCAKVKEHITEGVKRANAKATSRAQNVGKFEILDTDFSIGGDELTPTLKLKRRIVAEKYADVIEKMYDC